MDKGSLYECIIKDSGNRIVNGELVPMCEPIELGRILTLRKVTYHVNDDKTGIYFEEIINPIHPVLNVECAYNIIRFKKIQDPTQVDISELQHQTQTV